MLEPFFNKVAGLQYTYFQKQLQTATSDFNYH